MFGISWKQFGLLILFLLLFGMLIGAYEGILAFFLVVFGAFGFITWMYWDDIAYQN